MPNQETLELLHQANQAIFKAERAIAEEENQRVNVPMYQMRIDLQELIRVYMANFPVCEHKLISRMEKIT